MTPSRRGILLGAAALAAGAAAWDGAAAHTPYGQWVVYRQKHLLVGAHRGDGRTYTLAQDVVAAMAVELPDARAQIARGPRPQRIATLMVTGQLLLAVLHGEEAARMAAAEPPFEGHRPVPLRTVASLADGYTLYASPDLARDHAWLVARAMDHGGLGRRPEDAAIPPHPGATAFWTGGPLPE